MATIGDVLTGVLQDLGLIAAGETPAAEDQELALSRANDWIDSLPLAVQSLYAITRTTWTIVASTASYAIGVGSTVNVARPVGPEAIDNIGFINTTSSPTQETLFGRPLSEADYQGIAQKALTGVYPQAWYYAPTLTTGTLTPWPIPTSSSLQGVIYTKAQISEFATWATTFGLPPGYRRWFRLQLTSEIADAFKVPVDAATMQAAREADMAVKRGNTRVQDLTLNYPGLGNRFDINRGY
jgi:hypothetical protein